MAESDPNLLFDAPVATAPDRSPKDRESEVEALKQQSDVQKALKQTAGGPPTPSPTVEKKQKVFFLTYAVVLLLLTGLYYFLKHYVLQVGRFPPKAVLGAIAIATVVTAVKSIDVYLIDRVDDAVAEYNIRRVLKLVSWFVIASIVGSVLFADWYTAAVSL